MQETIMIQIQPSVVNIMSALGFRCEEEMKAFPACILFTSALRQSPSLREHRSLTKEILSQSWRESRHGVIHTALSRRIAGDQRQYDLCILLLGTLCDQMTVMLAGVLHQGVVYAWPPWESIFPTSIDFLSTTDSKKYRLTVGQEKIILLQGSTRRPLPFDPHEISMLGSVQATMASSTPQQTWY